MLSSLTGITLALVTGTVQPPSLSPSLLQEPTNSESVSASSEAIFVRAQRIIVRPGVTLENSSVLVRNGKILAVGRDLEKPADARELQTKVLCAAYLDPWGALGISGDALADQGAGPSTQAKDALDPYSDESIRKDTLRAGVTCARVQAGSTARTSGVGALLRVAPGLTREERLVAPESALGMSVGLSANAQGPQQTFEIVDGQVVQRESGSRGMDPFERMADVDRVAAAVESGRNYLVSKVEYKHELEEWRKKITDKETELDKDFKKAKKDREKEEKDAKEKGKKFEDKKYKEDKKPQPPKFDEDAEALSRVANGELSLFVQVHRAAELRSLLAATEKQDRLRLIFAGASEAMNCTSELIARHIPVVLTPAMSGRGAPDELEGADLSLAGRLSRAGVTVLLGSGGVDPAASRDLPLLAEIAIGNGLERDAAFEALTLGAARAFDVDSRIGSVERGKDAELLLLDGDPLTSAGRIRYVISAGRVVITPEN